MSGNAPGGPEKDTLVVEDVCDKPCLRKSSSIWRFLCDWDIQCSLWAHNIGLRTPRSLLQALEYSGDGLLWVPFTAAICLAPVFRAQHVFFDLLIGFLFDLMLIGTIKILVRRPRPVYNRGMYLVVSVDHYSFPSGHSSRAFLILMLFLEHSHLWKSILASYLKLLVKDVHNMNSVLNAETILYSAIVIMAVLWSVATACSRIMLGRHYIMDVIAGSFFGILEAIFVHKVVLNCQIMSKNMDSLLIQTRQYMEAHIWKIG